MNSFLRRLALVPVLAFVVATLGFFLRRAAPGGPFDQNRAPASKEVEAAQDRIIQIVRKLEEAEEITINETPTEERAFT